MSSTVCGGPVSAPAEPARRRSSSRGAPAWAPLGAFLLLATLAIAAVLVAGGCDRVCVRHSDCPHGAICTAYGTCAYPPEPADTEVDAGEDPSLIPDSPVDGSVEELDPSDPEAEAEAEPEAAGGRYVR